MFSSIQPPGSSVIGAHRGHGMGNSWLDYRLGRWTGQSGVQAPWGATAVVVPGPLGHLASICNVGVKWHIVIQFLTQPFLKLTKNKLLMQFAEDVRKHFDHEVITQNATLF